MRKVVLIVPFLMGLLAPGAAMAQSTALPPGPGVELVTRTCSACHGLAQIAAERHTADEWRDKVLTMVDHGAQANDAQVDTIVTYLATTFPPGPAPAPPAQ